MPNFMAFGFDREDFGKNVRPLLDQVAQALNLGDDAVVTYVPSLVDSCDGSHTTRPYLRICATDPIELGKIIMALREVNLGIDCEILLLPTDGFIPGEKMKADGEPIFP